MPNYYIAVDLGATSGRHILGHYEGEKLLTEEVYRFPNGPKKVDGHLIWDIDALFGHIKAGIKEAFKRQKNIISIAIDTWGVDYVLMHENEPILPCYAYRDERTRDDMDEVHSLIPFSKLYEKTGIQKMYFNTIYQLYDDKKAGRLENADNMLFLPQYFGYLLTGEKKNEYTIASTSGLLNAYTKDFDEGILGALGFDRKLFGTLFMPGESLGMLKDDIAREVGGNALVVLCASHDTASAFYAVEENPSSLFLSSGTWSLIGAKLPRPETGKKAFEYNFTNEGGVGYIRFLKNVTGMWISSGLKNEIGQDVYKMMEEAKKSCYEEYIDVDDPAFAAPTSMRKAIDEYLTAKGKPLPETIGDYYHMAFYSLAKTYDKVIKQIEDIAGTSFASITIVGGGANNTIVNEYTEKITGKKVIAIPIEATSIGNIKCQNERSK